MMLENWCWIPTIIQSLSCHYSYISDEYLQTWKDGNPGSRPPQTISLELAETLTTSRHVNGAITDLKQIAWATFDMSVHSPSSREELEQMDFAKMYNQQRTEITHLVGPEVRGGGYDWGNAHTRWGHIIRGYDGGYWAYSLSTAYSIDLFESCFRNDPMNQEMGLKWRYQVLEPGGSRDELTSLQDFLGRSPNVEAFYRQLERESMMLND